MEGVYEHFFFLKYAGGWSFSEAYNLPVGLRMWFVERLVQQLQDEKDAMEKGSSGSSSNTQVLSSHNQPNSPPQMRSQFGRTE
ncbi:hypothetical protein CMI37_11345 [Candidatus Pacearchaeota archaeon]|nr:hypothetical protein [Candidatus Pacearchaeota archaeon]|tara:strand:- start:1752 stop:2000 length:249 start_codon:yes stop_codon:yes gene_type:complete